MYKQITLKYNVNKEVDKKAIETLEILKEYSSISGIAFKHLIAKAVDEYLEKVLTKGSKNG